MGGPEAPEVTEPSRLVGESSGGEVRKQQLDTRVRQEPPGGPVSGAGGEGRGLGQALEPRGHHGAAWAWAPPLPCSGLPRGCWNLLVGAPACPSPGPLPSGWGFPAFRGPRRPRTQSSLGQPSTSPLSCPKWSYTTWSSGRAVRSRKKQLRTKSGVRAPGFPPQPLSMGFWRDQLNACFCLSFPLCTDRTAVLLSVLTVGGALGKGSRPQAHSQMPTPLTPCPFQLPGPSCLPEEG